MSTPTDAKDGATDQPYSEHLVAVWRVLLGQLATDDELSAAAIAVTESKGGWDETIVEGDAARVKVRYRLADGRATTVVMPLTSVWLIPVANAQIESLAAPTDSLWIGIGVTQLSHATYITTVGDPGLFGRLGWSDTPTPHPLAAGMIENVLGITATGDPLGEQMEAAAFGGVQPDALNRAGGAKKEIRRRYNRAEQIPGQLDSSNGDDQIRSVVRLAIADGAWPSAEWTVLVDRGQGPVVLAQSVHDRATHRWRSQMSTRVIGALAAEAFGATKQRYLQARQWEASYDDGHEMPDDDDWEQVLDARAAKVYGAGSVTEYELHVRGTDAVAIDRAEALEHLNGLGLTESQIKAWLLSFDHDHRYIADRLGISPRTVGRHIAAVRQEI
jgi:hypothetical protein